MMLRSWAVVTINARIGRVLHEHQRWKHSRNERHVNVYQPEFGALPEPRPQPGPGLRLGAPPVRPRQVEAGLVRCRLADGWFSLYQQDRCPGVVSDDRQRSKGSKQFRALRDAWAEMSTPPPAPRWPQPRSCVPSTTWAGRIVTRSCHKNASQTPAHQGC